MSKGQKTVTHHTIPVITSKKIGKQYNLAGRELSETRAKLEALGYLKAIRLGAHTYELLKPAIPDTLEDLEIEYVADRFTYTLPQAYTDTRAQLEALASEMERHANINYEAAADLKEKFTNAFTDISDALMALPDEVLMPADRELTFVCLPIHDEVVLGSPLSRQRTLENIINMLLLLSVYSRDIDELTSTQIMNGVNILRDVRIPSRITERMEAIKCAA